PRLREELKKNYWIVDNGYNSFPTQIPGEGGEMLCDDEIGDNIIGVLFAAQDTTATVMTWVVKYLHDEPKLLECVKV
ncbi:abscisic acid 8'-hydroxylase, partial [Trifolium medium]|nr:abscisic acid 8'-hydroxylase [Trifolium medium]